MENITFETQATFYLPDLTKKKIIDTEIYPVICVRNDDGKILACEAVTEESEAEMWSVYIRVEIDKDFNPVDCIADFPSKDKALEFEKLIRALLKLK